MISDPKFKLVSKIKPKFINDGVVIDRSKQLFSNARSIGLIFDSSCFRICHLGLQHILNAEIICRTVNGKLLA